MVLRAADGDGTLFRILSIHLFIKFFFFFFSVESMLINVHLRLVKVDSQIQLYYTSLINKRSHLPKNEIWKLSYEEQKS